METQINHEKKMNIQYMSYFNVFQHCHLTSSSRTLKLMDKPSHWVTFFTQCLSFSIFDPKLGYNNPAFLWVHV